ncbi:radical SAM protein [Clostridium sp. YIM B02555]|uniref:radical SAM protein n=1 Tax=Clostridium sp. YIM B02555 TaxID=2911968 RepID=UPI001EEEF41B|nr:radical SAM protein [Clostridium sp. YIM B02555]
MSVEIKALGVECNLNCKYCYENSQRKSKTIKKTYDIEKIIKSIEREGEPFVLFGGEPLLMPISDLETLFEIGLKKFGRNQIQTNGILINDRHIELFNRYNVDVGISIDGPDELNDLRWQNSIKTTRENTKKTINNIKRLCYEHRPPGLIITLHKLNASKERLDQLINWIRELDKLQILTMRLHLLEIESESIRQQYSLSDEENISALLKFIELQEELKYINIDIIDEIKNELLGKDRSTSCVWHCCDPYATQSVKGIDDSIFMYNCGRTNKDGVDFIKANKEGFQRYIALYNTPQEYGGCMGCRFFIICKGQCPGTALNGDWRNKSELCNVLKELFSHLENTLLKNGEHTITEEPTRYYIEKKLLSYWEKGIQTTLESICLSMPSNIESSIEYSKEKIFKIPSFVEYSFVGEKQYLYWKSRIFNIRIALARIGILSVSNGVVPISLIRVPTDRLFEFHEYAAKHKVHLKLLPRRKEDIFERVIVGKSLDLETFHKSLNNEDYNLIYKLLGASYCCLKNLQDKYNNDYTSVIDLTAPLDNYISENQIQYNQILNIFFRPLGIDLLGYLPCTLHCEKSNKLVNTKLILGRENGMKNEVDWLEEMLSWPLEWSSLHGIAELKTGILRLSNNSFFSNNKITIQYNGNRISSNAARGLSFVYNK